MTKENCKWQHCVRAQLLARTALCFAFVLAIASCGKSSPTSRRPNLRQLAIGAQTIWVEDARTTQAVKTGLMYRRSLEKDCGMLFTFPAPSVHDFYMKNCYIPIDLAYLEDDGTILEIHEMKVEDDPVSGKNAGFTKYPSSKPVKFALEMAGGWYAAHGVKPGDCVKHIIPGQ